MATAAGIEELMEKMREQREALLAEAEALSEEEALWAPADAEGEAQWSPKQQLAHLAEMETSYRAWVEAALAEDDPDVSDVRGSRPAIALTEAQDHSVKELTAQLRRERETTLTLIQSMTPE